MAELFKSKARFSAGAQRFFLISIQKTLGLSNSKLAKLLKISVRTLTDWKREKFLIPFSIIKTLSKKAKINIPTNITILDRYWYTRKGAKLGGVAVYKKYGQIGGDPEIRKKRWYEWWEKEGKNKHFPILRSLPLKKPGYSTDLAEFVGIMMGDGGMSRTQICITLHHRNDLKYSKFVIKLAKKLFEINPSVYHNIKYSVNNIVISRTELVKFLNSIGLPVGNKVKQLIDIPEWIKNNKLYKIFCLRGLIDTDGCVFLHKYKVNGKFYTYKKLSFTTASGPLRETVFEILKTLNFKPRISQNRDVRLDSQKDIKKYFKIIGSHNPKHLNKYRSVL